jgi:hypothetical protein
MIRYFKFRWALKGLIRDNSELLQMLAEHEKNEIPTNLTWDEDGLWKGWSFNISKNRYYFDDIGNESIMGLWEDQWLNEANER